MRSIGLSVGGLHCSDGLTVQPASGHAMTGNGIREERGGHPMAGGALAENGLGPELGKSPSRLSAMRSVSVAAMIANTMRTAPGVPSRIRRDVASGPCARCKTVWLNSPGTAVGAPGPFVFSLLVLPTFDAAISLAFGVMPAPLLTSELSAIAVSASHSSPFRESVFAARVHQWSWSVMAKRVSRQSNNYKARHLNSKHPLQGEKARPAWVCNKTVRRRFRGWTRPRLNVP